MTKNLSSRGSPERFRDDRGDLPVASTLHDYWDYRNSRSAESPSLRSREGFGLGLYFSAKDFSLRCASFEMTACRKKSLIIGTYHYQYLAKQRFALQRTNPSLFCRLLEYQEPVPTTIG